MTIWSLGSSLKASGCVVGLRFSFCYWMALSARAILSSLKLWHLLPCILFYNIAVWSFKAFRKISAAGLSLSDFRLWPRDLLFKELTWLGSTHLHLRGGDYIKCAHEGAILEVCLPQLALINRHYYEIVYRGVSRIKGGWWSS